VTLPFHIESFNKRKESLYSFYMSGFSDNLHRQFQTRLLNGLVLLLVIISSLTDTKASESSEESDTEAVQLTGKEILEAFANVRDDAEVQDAKKTRAVNQWYSDGRFISRWSNNKDSGEVTGSWRVQGDLRCIIILSGLSKRIGKERCSPVFQSGSKYLSFNPDGSIHGIHVLSPLQDSSVL